MTAEGFDAEDWVERLAAALPALAKAQEPYLQDDWEDHPRTVRIVNGRDVTPFPLDDVRILYQRSRDSWRFGEEAYFEPLRAALDPVRHTLLAHPVLARAVGRIIGQDMFYMQLPGSGADTSAGDLIAGLLARAAELPGDRFRSAARELSAFLTPAPAGAEDRIPVDIGEGCDLMLFYGLVVSERIEIGEGLALLPYGEVLRFVDEEHVQGFAPPGAGFHGWRAVGAVARRFRWQPAFRRRGRLDEAMPGPPGNFVQDAATFLDLLAVAHAAPVVPLVKLSNRIDRAAGVLLDREQRSPGLYQNWPAQGLDGFAGCPSLQPEGLREAQVVFEDREGARYRSLAHIVGRLARALARDGRFAALDKVVDVAIALEGMYDLPRRGVTSAMEERAAGVLGTDAESRDRIRRSARAFYDARSAIVHNKPAKATPFTNGAAFVTGFGLAQRSLFKLLREGAPENWDRPAVVGD